MPQLKQSIIDLKNLALKPYYAIRMSRPVWRGLLNRDAIQHFTAQPPALDVVQQRIVADLRVHGIACATLQELFPDDPHMLERMQEQARLLRERAIQNKKKQFLLQLFETFPLVDLHDPFFSFMLSDKVIDSVNTYLGMWSKFYYSTLNITLPVTNGEPPKQSQRWHRDPEDKRMCKIFVYLNDVDASAGPFVYARGSHGDGPYRHLFPQRPPHGYYPPDGAVEAKIPSQNILTCTGPAGSVIFADTSGIHKGGYATAKERMMLTAGFLTSASPRGIFFTPPSNQKWTDTLKPQIAYAVTGKKFGKGLGY